MAFALTRALGRLSVSTATPRLLYAATRVTPTPRPRFSFGQSVGGRPLQPLESRSASFVAFAATTTTRCSKSAEKRHRQSEKRRIRNKIRKNEIKNRTKQVFKALEVFSKEAPKALTDLDSVEPLMRQAFKAIDKAVQKGTLHRNTGARRKSRLARARLRVLVQSRLVKPEERPQPPSLVEAYEARRTARREALKQRVQEQLALQESA